MRFSPARWGNATAPPRGFAAALAGPDGAAIIQKQFTLANRAATGCAPRPNGNSRTVGWGQQAPGIRAGDQRPAADRRRSTRLVQSWT